MDYSRWAASRGSFEARPTGNSIRVARNCKSKSCLQPRFTPAIAAFFLSSFRRGWRSRIWLANSASGARPAPQTLPAGEGCLERNDMSRKYASRLFACSALLIGFAGCANRPGWGFSWGQGTTDRQKARAVVHDPYPINDIGPAVDGGRPRGFMNPQPEATRAQVTRSQFPGQIR